MIGTLWEGKDETVFYVVGQVTPHGWRVINLTAGALDYLWLQDERMRHIDTREWLRKVET